MAGELTFQDTTPRDMNVRLDGAVVGECFRTQWKSNGTMLYLWTARLDARFRPVDDELSRTSLEVIEAGTKNGIKRAVAEAIKAALARADDPSESAPSP